MEKVKVFISSTQVDLQPERNAVEKLIQELGYECLRAEKHIAPAKSPKETCREMARTCDIYIGIYGGRYGFIDKELGVSVTEMEYDEARKDDTKKLLIYIKEDGKCKPRQRKFLNKVEDFHDGYFRHDFFSSTRKLSEQVRNDLAAWVVQRIRKFKQMERDLLTMRDKVDAIRSYYGRMVEAQNLSKDIIL